MQEHDAPFERREADAAPRREHRQHAEALLHVVPADEQEHQLDHPAEPGRRAHRDRRARPDGEHQRHDDAGDQPAPPLRRLPAEGAALRVSVEEQVRDREVRVVDHGRRVERDEPDGELRGVEPDRAPEEPRERDQNSERRDQVLAVVDGAHDLAMDRG